MDLLTESHVKEQCAKVHTKSPRGYSAWHEWAEKKSKRHYQVECPHCGRYAIWKRKSSNKRPEIE